MELGLLLFVYAVGLQADRASFEPFDGMASNLLSSPVIAGTEP